MEDDKSHKKTLDIFVCRQVGESLMNSVRSKPHESSPDIWKQSTGLAQNLLHLNHV